MTATTALTMDSKHRNLKKPRAIALEARAPLAPLSSALVLLGLIILVLITGSGVVS